MSVPNVFVQTFLMTFPAGPTTIDITDPFDPVATWLVQSDFTDDQVRGFISSVAWIGDKGAGEVILNQHGGCPGTGPNVTTDPPGAPLFFPEPGTWTVVCQLTTITPPDLTFRTTNSVQVTVLQQAEAPEPHRGSTYIMIDGEIW